MKAIVFNILILFNLSCFAQFSVETYHKQSNKLTKQNKPKNVDYEVMLRYNPPNPLNESSSLKKNPNSNGNSLFKSSNEVELPLIQYGFEDIHDTYWIPNDNSMAVSNNGYIVSIQNSKIAIYDSTFQLVQWQKLNDFTDSLGLPETKFDPRVIYDQNEDRFVTVMLAGYEHSTSQIVIGFSSTANPLDGWSFYSIPGNFMNDSSWSDFPSIALSNEELFITVTNFDDYLTDTYWKFTGCRIIQMNKMQGFSGDSAVDYTYHFINPGYGATIPSDVYYYNAIPVKGSDSLYGPDMYFVSTLDCPFADSLGNFSPNDTVFLVKFNGNQYYSGFSIESHYLQSPFNYGISGTTEQPYSQELKTNYNTVLETQFFNNKIHFLLNSIDYSNNQAGIYHGIIEDPGGSKTLSATMISYDTIGIAFPAMARFGATPADEKFIIGFNYAGANLNPGNASIVYDNGNYSSMKILKEGETVMNMTSSNAERWGDYTCMQKKYNEPDFIFFVGSYGVFYSTYSWISILTLDTAYLGIGQVQQNDALLFPVPASQRIQVRFKLSEPQFCSFSIYSMDGKLIDEIYSDKVLAGENEFSFDVSSLSDGMYILLISGSEEFSSSKKFTVSHY